MRYLIFYTTQGRTVFQSLAPFLDVKVQEKIKGCAGTYGQNGIDKWKINWLQ